MARELNEDELIGNWTLAGDELEQLSGRRGATKLGFALLLRFYAVHGVNDYIRFGKRGELASNRHEEQELGMLCLHILQSSLGLINTLMIQDTLALPEWAGVLTDADRRGLTPVFHTNMTPYGEIQLRTDRRLDLTGIPLAAT